MVPRVRWRRYSRRSRLVGCLSITTTVWWLAYYFSPPQGLRQFASCAMCLCVSAVQCVVRECGACGAVRCVRSWVCFRGSEGRKEGVRQSRRCGEVGGASSRGANGPTNFQCCSTMRSCLRSCETATRHDTTNDTTRHDTTRPTTNDQRHDQRHDTRSHGGQHRRGVGARGTYMGWASFPREARCALA
jgi:hypothetical protein